MDEDVAWLVRNAVVRQFEDLASHLEGVTISEGHRGQRAILVAGPREEALRFFVCDDDGHIPERSRAADVIDVRVAVDEVRNRLVRNLPDAFENVVGIRRRRIYDDDAGVVDQEYRLVDVIGDHVEAAAEILQPICLARIERGAPGLYRYRQVSCDWHPDGRNRGRMVGRKGIGARAQGEQARGTVRNDAGPQLCALIRRRDSVSHVVSPFSHARTWCAGDI
jgi:hypothetical protein